MAVKQNGLITQPENAWYLILKPAYIAIGIALVGKENTTSRTIAGLLNILEVETKTLWEKRRKEAPDKHPEGAPMPSDLWVWKTINRYKEQLFSVGSVNTISEALRLLFKVGLVARQEHKNGHLTGSRKYWEYRLCVSKLQKIVSEYPEFPSLILSMGKQFPSLIPEIPVVNPEIPVVNPGDKKSNKAKSKKQKSKKKKDLSSFELKATENKGTGKTEKPETDFSSIQEKENTPEKPDSSQSADEAETPPTNSAPSPRKQDPLFNAITHTMRYKSGGRVGTLWAFFNGITVKNNEWKTHQDIFIDDPVSHKEMLAFGWWIGKHGGGREYMPQSAERLANKFELFRATPEHDVAMQHAQMYLEMGILETTWEKRGPEFGGQLEIVKVADEPDKSVGRETPEQIKQRIDGIAALVAQFSVPIRDD